MFSNIQIANFVNKIIEEYALFLEDKFYFSQMANSIEKYLTLLDKEPQLLQRIPLTYIASFLGITRETLSRLRAKWFCDICQVKSLWSTPFLHSKNDCKYDFYKAQQQTFVHWPCKRLGCIFYDFGSYAWGVRKSRSKELGIWTNHSISRWAACRTSFYDFDGIFIYLFK